MSPRELQGFLSHLREVAKDSDAVVSVSESLSDKLKMDYGITTEPLPNGADLSRLRSVEAPAVKALRKRYGLDGRFVVGYIGNHGSYTGVDLVVSAFDLLKERMPEAVLMIVGPAGCWSRLRDGNRDNVIFTGPINPQGIAPYFQVLDLGVLAQEDSSGTKYAFQLKIVEYTACRKHIISTPLQACQRLGWPNIHFVERQPEAWANAVMELKAASWKPEWDALVEPYDWNRLADRLGRCLLGDAL